MTSASHPQIGKTFAIFVLRANILRGEVSLKLNILFKIDDGPIMQDEKDYQRIYMVL